MAILGINNRTENWKTAKTFVPLMSNPTGLTALAKRLGETSELSGKDIHLELFWKGMRDYVHENETYEDLRSECAKAYELLFPRLRNKINKFAVETKKLKCLEDKNYDVSNSAGQDGLYQNLRNTEIDIVLQTSSSLYIGEAKEEAGLGADGECVLVHQLIRQYVMAKILLHLMGSEKRVVPFLVVEKGNLASVKKTGQVRFMIDVKKCLVEDNVLTWDDINSPHL